MIKTVNKVLTETIAFHVDDAIHSTEKDPTYEKFLEKIQEKFPVKNLGRPQKFLGLYFKTIPGGIRLHLEPYIKELLERFNLINLPIAHAPAPAIRLIKGGKPITGDPKKHYRAMLGAVLWIAGARHRVQCDTMCAILRGANGGTLESAPADLFLSQGNCSLRP